MYYLQLHQVHPGVGFSIYTFINSTPRLDLIFTTCQKAFTVGLNTSYLLVSTLDEDLMFTPSLILL